MRIRVILIMTVLLSAVAVPAVFAEDSYGDLNVIKADRAYFEDGLFILEFDPGITGTFECQVTDWDGNSIMASAPAEVKNETRMMFAPDDTGSVLPAGDYQVQMYNPSAVVSEIVKVPVLATGIHLDRVSLDMDAGESTVLTASLSPDNVSDRTVEWRSSDAKVAAVDNNGKVTAVSEGTATITAESGDGMASAECKVTVTGSGEPLPDVPEEDGSQGSGLQTSVVAIAAVALLLAAVAAVALLKLRKAP